MIREMIQALRDGVSLYDLSRWAWCHFGRGCVCRPGDYRPDLTVY